jgi:hypothetical protein
MGNFAILRSFTGGVRNETSIFIMILLYIIVQVPSTCDELLYPFQGIANFRSPCCSACRPRNVYSIIVATFAFPSYRQCLENLDFTSV